MQHDKQRPERNPTHQGHADRPNAEHTGGAHPPNTGEYPSGQGNPEETGNQSTHGTDGSQSGQSWTGDRTQGNLNPGTNDPTGMATDMNQAGSVPGGQGNVGDRAGQVGSQGWSEGEDPTKGAQAGAMPFDRGPVGGDGGGPEDPEEISESDRGRGWRGGGK
jgi:hypothetical protein